MSIPPQHTVVSLDDTVTQTTEFRISSQFDELPFEELDMKQLNNGYTTWVDKIAAGLRSIDSYLKQSAAHSAAAASGASVAAAAQDAQFETPFGWISRCPHELLDYENCGTIDLLFSTDDTCEEPKEFYRKYCRGSDDHQPVELCFERDQMHAKLDRAESNRESKASGNMGSLDESKLSDLDTDSKSTFTMEKGRYHIIPLDIRVRYVANNTPVPVGYQLETDRPGFTTRRKWFAENGQTNQRDGLSGSYGVHAPANHKRDDERVVFRADHNHLNHHDFRHWGPYPTEELELRLRNYEHTTGLYYLIPAPNVDAQHFPDVLQYAVLRHYPWLYRQAKKNSPGVYATLTADTWYNRETQRILVPKIEMQNFIAQIRRNQNCGLNMMCCSDMKLVLTPLNKSGWQKIARLYNNFDGGAYTNMPPYHPAKQLNVAVEVSIRYVPMRKPQSVFI